ncbi:MAG: lipid-binding SYLF domain-containing protein [Desulforhabdus sp.]|jgi:lipid-binding SYLF domain-containing protein|nr:lipid-binding SYLF domain-containing protein [Desulforhabdus sp.]
MNIHHFRSLRQTGTMVALAFLVIAWITAVYPSSAIGDDRTEGVQLVEKARFTMEDFLVAKEMGPFRGLLKTAKGVFIAPQVLEGAFIFGVSGGSGLLLVRDAKTGTWNGPAFYTMGEFSFGLQAGGQASDIVLLAMTDRGVNAFLADSVKLGADIGVALGPVGAGAEAATANLSADILSFARSKGAYAGVSAEGAVVATRDGWNAAYYEKEVSPREILIDRKVHNPQADTLIKAVTIAAGAK